MPLPRPRRGATSPVSMASSSEGTPGSSTRVHPAASTHCPGAVPTGLGRQLAALHHVGHAPREVGHRAAACRVAGGNRLTGGLVADEAAEEGVRHAFPGHVIGSGAQPAAEDDQLGPGEQIADRPGHRVLGVLDDPLLRQEVAGAPQDPGRHP